MSSRVLRGVRPYGEAPVDIVFADGIITEIAPAGTGTGEVINADGLIALLLGSTAFQPAARAADLGLAAAVPLRVEHAIRKGWEWGALPRAIDERGLGVWGPGDLGGTFLVDPAVAFGEVGADLPRRRRLDDRARAGRLRSAHRHGVSPLGGHRRPPRARGLARGDAPLPRRLGRRMPRRDEGQKTAVTNRKALRDYEILERFEAGIGTGAGQRGQHDAVGQGEVAEFQRRKKLAHRRPLNSE